jgi:hypothetical protein
MSPSTTYTYRSPPPHRRGARHPVPLAPSGSARTHHSGPPHRQLIDIGPRYARDAVHQPSATPTRAGQLLLRAVRRGQRRRRGRPLRGLRPDVAGRTHTINSRNTDAMEGVPALTDGNGANVVVDALGRPETHHGAGEVAGVEGLGEGIRPRRRHHVVVVRRLPFPPSGLPAGRRLRAGGQEVRAGMPPVMPAGEATVGNPVHHPGPTGGPSGTGTAGFGSPRKVNRALSSTDGDPSGASGFTPSTSTITI